MPRVAGRSGSRRPATRPRRPCVGWPRRRPSTGCGKRAPAVAAEALECLGGNGYVEESGVAPAVPQAPPGPDLGGRGQHQQPRRPAGAGQAARRPGGAAGGDRAGSGGRAAARPRGGRPGARAGRSPDPAGPRPGRGGWSSGWPCSSRGRCCPSRHPAVADAFCASRWPATGAAFGTLRGASGPGCRRRAGHPQGGAGPEPLPARDGAGTVLLVRLVATAEHGKPEVGAWQATGEDWRPRSRPGGARPSWSRPGLPRSWSWRPATPARTILAKAAQGSPTTAAPTTTPPTTAAPTTTEAPPTTEAPATTEAPTTTKPKPAAPARPGPARGRPGHAPAAHELGYQVQEADGQFGPETHHSVVAFQKVNGLGRDGVVGPITRKALERPRVPRPAPPRRALHVEADLTLQVVYMVSGGKIVEVLDASSASGQTYTVDGDVRLAVTPQGSFVIQRKIDARRRSKLGLSLPPRLLHRRLRPPRRPLGPAVPGQPRLHPHHHHRHGPLVRQAPRRHPDAGLPNVTRGLRPVGPRNRWQG